MKYLLILTMTILLVGCTSFGSNKEVNNTQINRELPFHVIKDQPKPETIIQQNPRLTDEEWKAEWYKLISAHESYLRSYITILVTSMNVGPKTQCNVSAIIDEFEEPAIPSVKGIQDPEEINIILAKAIRSMYESYNDLLGILKNCK